MKLQDLTCCVSSGYAEWQVDASKRQNHTCAILQVSYDTAKHAYLALGMPDNTALHFSAGLTAGFAATVLGSPWDVIGTRLMARSSPSKGKACRTLHQHEHELAVP